MKLDTPNQFSTITIVLHWLIGLFMIGLLAVGVYMVETKTYSLYSWHKAFGFLIFFVIVLRIVWRIKNGWPIPISQYKKTEHLIAKAVHWILILGTVLLPVSGFLSSSISGNGVSIFGFEIVAQNPDPKNINKVLAHSKDLASLFLFIHQWIGYIIIGSLVLHILGSLKHHFIDKDGTLRRILGTKA